VRRGPEFIRTTAALQLPIPVYYLAAHCCKRLWFPGPITESLAGPTSNHSSSGWLSNRRGVYIALIPLVDCGHRAAWYHAPLIALLVALSECGAMPNAADWMLLVNHRANW
jgi:hypothetical protein